jgi:hypothetical protein
MKIEGRALRAGDAVRVDGQIRTVASVNLRSHTFMDGPEGTKAPLAVRFEGTPETRLLYPAAVIELAR